MFLFQTLSSVAQVKVIKDINYAYNTDEKNTLNIYYKKDSIQKDVIVFVHGGSWSSGKKETYWWLGRNFASKNIVSIVINYPLAPKVTYKEMALATAQAVKWVQDSVTVYGGNPKRIFLMGHSVGAHLIELVNADPQYFKATGIANPVKGIILNDPFGLDMYQYLIEAEKDHYYDDFLRTFSDKPETWKLGSPLYYVENIKNSHILLHGSKTYTAIKTQTPRLYKELNENKIPVEIHEIKGKKHVGMISQMISGGNQLYPIILDFMKRTP